MWYYVVLVVLYGAKMTCNVPDDIVSDTAASIADVLCICMHHDLTSSTKSVAISRNFSECSHLWTT